ncbi:tRNA lysidine(34) synthetase TilS [Fimbriiglobus ruber]|uniref:tRNA(Ile)-lysidine synthase n=1 Tax=Fimbriiglobus ruber TaxID=1908690 RepID=A0A225DA13_9BACT|nr:tRNA lysidine(34) synthetase TilS [Fimbriiglobus ruber]OWK38450.1 tRNA(Ile)-lysidine synthetase [Fimbriiglobus ruber]
MARLAAEVGRFLDRHHLRGRTGVAAVSGGADSVALLRAFVASGVHVAVAHFNHQLRGPDADRDEAFVRDLAVGLGVPVHVGTADVRGEATRSGGNLEATARGLRYDWLGRIAAEVGAGWVATGHTADDQAETVIHRLVRGTGLQGLRGIAPVRPLTADVSLVRPLLGVTRVEIIGYLNLLDQPHREDASNVDPAFTRNRIRHELLPLLKIFNPEVVSALGRLAGQADEAQQVVDRAAADLLAAAERPRAGHLLVFAADTLTAAPPHLVRAMFRLAWEREGWPGGAMTAAHWERLHGMTRDDASAVDFPGGVTARRVGRVVQLGRRL